MQLKTWMYLALALAGAGVSGAELRNEGVIGNSGAWDKPVLYGNKSEQVTGLGAVYDARSGLLYDRAGEGKLIGYRLDGSVAVEYRLPANLQDQRDQMVLCGDYLAMTLKNNLYRIKVGSPPGTMAEKVNVPAEIMNISGSARDGKIVVLNKDKSLHSVDVAAGTATRMGMLPAERVNGMDWDAAGRLFILLGKEANLWEKGKLVENDDWPKTFIGRREGGIDRGQRFGNYWYGSGGHGTIKRFDLDFSPAPGVVQGGASGHFIGYVPCNYEIESGRGMSEIQPGLFAIGGLRGVIHLAEWRPELKQLVLTRRIGGLPTPGTLGVDSKGRVFAERNIWNWNDNVLNPADLSLVWQAPLPITAAMADADTLVMLAFRHGNNFLASGKLGEREMYANAFKDMALPKNPIGLAVMPGARQLLILGRAGDATLHEIAATDRSNNWRKNLGAVKLETASPAKVWGGCGIAEDGTLVAAADNYIVLFKKDGTNWKESARWTDNFGPELRIAVSKGRVLVSDSAKDRIGLYDIQGGKVAEAAVKRPGHVALNGPFAVVYETSAQRILKFRMED